MRKHAYEKFLYAGMSNQVRFENLINIALSFQFLINEIC